MTVVASRETERENVSGSVERDGEKEIFRQWMATIWFTGRERDRQRALSWVSLEMKTNLRLNFIFRFPRSH